MHNLPFICLLSCSSVGEKMRRLYQDSGRKEDKTCRPEIIILAVHQETGNIFNSFFTYCYSPFYMYLYLILVAIQLNSQKYDYNNEYSNINKNLKASPHHQLYPHPPTITTNLATKSAYEITDNKARRNDHYCHLKSQTS